jgi:hypothetical protein
VGLQAGFGFPDLAGAAISGIVFGFVAGSSFAVILSLTERRRRLDQLSLKRVALWGGIGGAALSLFFAPYFLGAGFPLGLLITTYFVPLGITGLLGAGFASGSVALARRAGPKLIEGDHEGLPALEGE